MGEATAVRERHRTAEHRDRVWKAWSAVVGPIRRPADPKEIVGALEEMTGGGDG